MFSSQSMTPLGWVSGAFVVTVGAFAFFKSFRGSLSNKVVSRSPAVSTLAMAMQSPTPMGPSAVLKVLRMFLSTLRIQQLPHQWKHSFPQTTALLALYHRSQLAKSARSAVLDTPLDPLPDQFNRIERIRLMRSRNEQRKEIEDAAHWIVYANSAYGVLLNSAFGLIDVAALGASLSLEDVILNRTGLKPDDLVSVSSSPNAPCPVYFCAIDHKLRAIVISIRGTLSLDDVLTDLIATDQHFPPEIPADRKLPESHPKVAEYARVHSGIGSAALAMYEGEGGLKGYIDEILREHQCYRLVITGHSLGGGCAVALAMILMQREPRVFALAKSGKLRVWGFASPPMMLTTADLNQSSIRDHLDLLNSAVRVVACADDAVTRLSARSVAHLLHVLFEIDTDAKLSKLKRAAIVRAGLTNAAARLISPIEARVRKHDESVLERQKSIQTLSESDSSAAAEDMSDKDELDLDARFSELKLPGEFVYWILSTSEEHADQPETARKILGTRSTDRSNSVIRAVDPAVFTELLLTAGCIRSHFPDSYEIPLRANAKLR
eukprot:CAMPEP_0182445468 /NCGR_PEP_ID=MMETSP1172-20130603/3578_1 /TAXON_ID=708627 /ORGANISM="Timspurckia oligopyrenoides, Strain CCMP3278" /LENGTH=549 /DNA_ID=CAMNT_0024641245 /DNA_START=371 /DNA_END=2020 /DNA_ORIENTATION=-